MIKRVFALLIAAVAASTARADSITTFFIGTNGGASLWTVYFDINVTNPNGINITGFDVNSSTAPNTAFSLDVYTTVSGGTHVGNTSLPAAWTLMGTGSGLTAGTDLPSNVDVSDFTLAQGTYGMAIRYIGAAPRYTNGNGSNQFFSNADVALTLGQAQATTTAPFTGGTPFSPRVWNGTIYYDINAIPEPGSLGLLGLVAFTGLVRRRRVA